MGDSKDSEKTYLLNEDADNKLYTPETDSTIPSRQGKI